MGKAIKSSAGQAIVEYIVMLAVVISFIVAVRVTFKNALLGVWGFYIQQITAACPTGCPTNPSYKFH